MTIWKHTQKENAMKSAWKLKGLMAARIWIAAIVTFGGVAHADERPIHPDCTNNPHPELCTEMVNDLLTELGKFNEAFISPNLQEAADYYHPRAILYTAATNFLIGRESIKNTLLAPLFAAIRTASVDFHKFHFSVISPSMIVSYGALPATIVLSNGTTLQQPPLPQTLTWIRNESFDRKRPFLITSDHE
jgi:hypothetical protein